MGWHHEWMNGMGGFMFPGLGLIIIVVLVTLVIWFLRGGRGGRIANGESADQHTHFETPLEILKRRYARGDISTEDYDKMKKDLQS